MKTAPVIAILLLWAIPASTQQLRAVAGVGFGDYATTWEMTTERRPGAVLGGGVEFGSGRAAVEVDLLYMQKKNYYVSRGWEFALSELSVPVLAKVKPLPRISPYLVAGWETAFILSQNETGAGPAERWTLDTRKMDYGLVFGAGMSFPAGAVSLEVEARLHHGLANTTRFSGDEYDFKTRVIALLAALKF